MAGRKDEHTLESLERKYGIPEPVDSTDQYPYGEWVPPTGPDHLGLAIRAFRVVLWIVAALGALYVLSVFWDGLEAAGYHGDNNQRWIPFAGVVALTAAVFALLWSYRDPNKRDDLKPGALLALVLLGITGFMIYQSRDNNDRLVGDYCSYGTNSIAQWIGCVQNVEPGQVIYSDTPAADFANGKQGDCGIDSGPFCGAAAQSREAQEALSELEREERWP